MIFGSWLTLMSAAFLFPVYLVVMTHKLCVLLGNSCIADSRTRARVRNETRTRNAELSRFA